ncbi:DUF4435 domain-containing protein [Bacillus cereus]|uniref:DUF4435 domain-containing protein n=1 Tax=Bacillus cereus TaxID=1396 RepID=UPI000BF25F67|nr:DUF4435 domain-containing protein [Bacillus cereus]PFT36092.1 hypothetical protein COK71_09785 [Bacillus cereus]
MKHDLEEWITEAIMSETPVVIVEGHDDIQFYEKLVNELGKEITVDAVENIEGYDGGARGVLECIKDLQPKLKERQENIKYILGIIDRDARFYRNEIPDHLGLLILEYYSFESHFITRQNLIEAIPSLTHVSRRHVDANALTHIEEDLYNNEFKDLYYISLEALKNACQKDYVGEVSYKEEPGKIFNEPNKSVLMGKLSAKKLDLDKFAQSKNIVFGDLKKFARGKWILYIYSKYLNEKIKKMKNACSNGEITKCNFCKAGAHDKCLWKVKTNFQLGHVKVIITNYIDETEIKYIKDRIRLLA